MLKKSTKQKAELRAGVQKAVRAVGNNKTELARNLGIKVQSIQQWKRVPAEQVLEVERVTGVSKHELRPDLYPIEKAT